jgi:hypothetical protein
LDARPSRRGGFLYGQALSVRTAARFLRGQPLSARPAAMKFCAASPASLIGGWSVLFESIPFSDFDVTGFCIHYLPDFCGSAAVRTHAEGDLQ